MQRMHSIIHPEGKAKVLLDHIQRTMGTTPNFLATLANAPVVLEAFISFNKTMDHGKLNPQLREQLALTVAGFNGCDYCASAYTYLGSQIGIDTFELQCNLAGRSSNSRTQAALNFARILLEKRGNIDRAALEAVKSAGYTHEEIIEIQAHVALNIFTNYFNESMQTHIDFPVVSTLKTKKVA